MGIRFKIANWIMQDQLRINLACANHNIKQARELLERDTNSDKVKIYHTKRYARKANKNIEELFKM